MKTIVIELDFLEGLANRPINSSSVSAPAMTFNRKYTNATDCIAT